MQSVLYNVRDSEGQECILLGFTGGEYNTWAIVTYGGDLRRLPLGDVSWIDPKDTAEDQAFRNTSQAIRDLEAQKARRARR